MSSLPEPTRPFDLALRGYARNQVDAYLAETYTALADYQQRVVELEAETDRLRRELAETAEPSYTGLGARVRQILHLAEEQAGEIRRDAHTDAEHIIDRAREVAAEIVDTATADAEQIRRDAKLAVEQAHAAVDAERRRVEAERSRLDQRVAALRAALADAAPVDPDGDEDTETGAGAS